MGSLQSPVVLRHLKLDVVDYMSMPVSDLREAEHHLLRQSKPLTLLQRQERDSDPPQRAAPPWTILLGAK